MPRFVKNWLLPTYANNYKAYLLTNKALIFYTVVLLVANLLFTGASANKTFALLDEQQIVALHNRERSKAGLGALKINYTLSLSAKAKGQAMLTNDCWSHYCPEGTSPWKYFRDVGYSYAYAGENLAEGFTNNEAMMQAWMNSKTHRENILKAEFTEVGIAMVVGNFQGIANNTIVVVHFGRPKATVAKTAGSLSQPKAASSTKPQPVSEPEVPLQITYPTAGSHLPDNRPNFQGTSAKPVRLEIAGVSTGRIIPNGGIFTYEPEDPLVDGNHELKALEADNESKVVGPISFTIDTIAPQIDTSLINLYDIEEVGGGLVYKFGLVASEELAQFSLVGNQDLQPTIQLENLSTKVWSLNISAPRRSNLGESVAGLTFSLTDLAGNRTELSFSGSELEKIVQRDDADKILGLRNVSTWQLTKQSLLANFDRLRELNLFEVLSLGLLIMLLGLFIIDYLVINYSELKLQHGVKSRANLHIPFIAIMILLVVMGNLSGGI